MHKLAEIARNEAMKFYHGYVSETESNLDEIIGHFPKWTKQEADGLWCAAFVYHCCRSAGYEIPIRPKECVSSNLAGCLAWEEWAKADQRIGYFERSEAAPHEGDIVLFDRVFENAEHDHIVIVVRVNADSILTAEGNFNNVSCLVERRMDEHIRAYIRIPEGFVY